MSEFSFIGGDDDSDDDTSAFAFTNGGSNENENNKSQKIETKPAVHKQGGRKKSRTAALLKKKKETKKVSPSTKFAKKDTSTFDSSEPAITGAASLDMFSNLSLSSPSAERSQPNEIETKNEEEASAFSFIPEEPPVITSSSQQKQESFEPEYHSVIDSFQNNENDDDDSNPSSFGFINNSDSEKESKEEDKTKNDQSVSSFFGLPVEQKDRNISENKQDLFGVPVTYENPFEVDPWSSPPHDFAKKNDDTLNSSNSNSDFHFGVPLDTFDISTKKVNDTFSDNDNFHAFDNSGGFNNSDEWNSKPNNSNVFDIDENEGKNKPNSSNIFDIDENEEKNKQDKNDDEEKEEKEDEDSFDIENMVPANSNEFTAILHRFVKRMTNANEKYIREVEEMKQFEKEQEEAMNNEQFEIAGALDSKIKETKLSIEKRHKNFTTIISSAMSLSKDATDYVKEFVNNANASLPQMIKEEEELETKIQNLSESQKNDEAKIQEQIEENKQAKQKAEAPVIACRIATEKARSELEEKKAQKRAPYEQKIQELDDKRLEKIKKAEELEELARKTREEALELQNQVSSCKNQMKLALNEFSSETQLVEFSEKNLVREEENLKIRISEIEAPLLHLMQIIEKRKNAMKEAEETIKEKRKVIRSFQKDTQSIEKSFQFINKLYNVFKYFNEHRFVMAQKYETAKENEVNAEKRRDEINSKTVKLQQEQLTTTKSIKEGRIQMEDLEGVKKAAVQAKNFKGASLANKQIKALEIEVKNDEEKIEKIQKEIQELENEIKQLGETIEMTIKEENETMKNLLQIDSRFYLTSLLILKKLFRISPFSIKLLEPLKELLIFAQNHSNSGEPVPQFTPEEITQNISKLNEQLNEAISKDDFDNADVIQAQIDAFMDLQNPENDEEEEQEPKANDQENEKISEKTNDQENEKISEKTNDQEIQIQQNVEKDDVIQKSVENEEPKSSKEEEEKKENKEEKEENNEEKEPQLSNEETQAKIDELEQKLNELIEIEDYDQAEIIQNQIDALNAKLG